MHGCLEIRAGRRPPAARLRAIGIAGRETAYVHFIGAENRRRHLNGPFWSADRLRAVLADPACWCLVAAVDGQAVGFLTIEPHPAHGRELTRFYVLPEYHGRGIGRALLQAAIGRLRDEGARELLVNVFGDTRAGRRFYERHGFVLLEESTTVVGEQTVYDTWYLLHL